MNYSLFAKRFTPMKSGGISSSNLSIFDLYGSIYGAEILFSKFGGQSFESGAYRIVQSGRMAEWGNRIGEAFPVYKGRVMPFGYDWLGRFFCVDLNRIKSDDPYILLFSIFSDEVLEIPGTLVSFHNEILLDNTEAALELEKFELFRKTVGIKEVQHEECVELVLPLYLSGRFDINNMKITNMALYWDISAQVLFNARNIESGAKIDSVSIQRSH